MTSKFLSLIIAIGVFTPTEKAPTNDAIAKSIQCGWYSSAELRALRGTSRTHRNAVAEQYPKQVAEAIANRDAERLRRALCACRIPPAHLDEAVEVLVAVQPELAWLKTYLKYPILHSNILSALVDTADWRKFRTLLLRSSNIPLEDCDQWADAMYTKMIESQRWDDLCEFIFADKVRQDQIDSAVEAMIEGRRHWVLCRLIKHDKLTPPQKANALRMLIDHADRDELCKLVVASKLEQDQYNNAITSTLPVIDQCSDATSLLVQLAKSNCSESVAQQVFQKIIARGELESMTEILSNCAGEGQIAAARALTDAHRDDIKRSLVTSGAITVRVL